jgi:peptide/nickel transport system substrate-binding protein
MEKNAIRILVFMICILGELYPAFTEQPPAPRGELHIVDKRPENRWTIDENRMEALVRYTDDGELVPSLARRWRWVDDRTLDIQLRQGVKFQNGEVLDAEIVKFNLEFRRGRRRLYEKPGLLNFWWDLPVASRIEIVNAYTIRLVLPAPDAETVFRLIFPRIINRQFYRTLDKLAKEQNKAPEYLMFPLLRRPGPWGTGPYILQKGESQAVKSLATQQTKQVILEANPNYWDRTRFPKIQRVVYDNDLAQDAALELLKTSEGRVDLVTDIRPIDTLRVAQSPFGKVLKEREYVRSMHGMFNTRKADSPWRDVRLRQAVNYAINRAHFMRYAAKGNGVLVPSLLPPAALGFDPNLAPYPFDPDRARRLLREAGYHDGLTITLLATERSKVQATVVSKMLEQVGFKVQVQIANRGAWYKQTSDFWFGSPLFQNFNRSWPSWDIALNILYDRFPRSLLKGSTSQYRAFALFGPMTWIHVAPELYRLQTEATSATELVQKRLVIQRMERHTRDQAYFLFLYSPIQLYAVNKAVNFNPVAGALSLVDLSVTDAHWSVRKQKATVEK